MKRKLFLALAVVSLAILGGAGIVLADDGNISFGIRPTKAYEDRPETFSYFSYELAAGSVMSDEALVMNSGDVTLTLKLFAADGITAIGSGTAFAQQGQEISGVAGWLSLSVTEIRLEPGEDRVVPFTINVPPDASPGHHVVGVVVEAPPSGEDKGQFTVNVVRQAAVAVVIDVPGPHVAGLEVSSASLRQQDDQGATFVITVHNTGNIFIKAEGSLLIADLEGKELASISLKMDTVLPGDTTTFQVTHPVHLADGRYLLNAILKYADGQVALLEGVEVKVIDGQPEMKDESKVPVLPPGITEITSPLSASLTLVPGSAATLKTGDGRISVSFPQGAVISQAEVSLRSYPLEQLHPPPTGFNLASTCFRIDGLTGLLVKEATVTVKYTPADLNKEAGDASRLRLARWDEANRQWSVLKTRLDKEAKTLSTSTNQLSIWAVMVAPSRAPPAEMNLVVLTAIAAGVIIIFLLIIFIARGRRR